MALPIVHLQNLPMAMAQDMARFAQLHAIEALIDATEPAGAIVVMPVQAWGEHKAKAVQAAALILLGAGELPELPVPVVQLTLPVALPAWLTAVRRCMAATQATDVVLDEGWVFSLSQRHLQHDVQIISLTDKEAELLAVLLGAAPEAVAKERLLALVWGYGAGVDTHTLETHIYRLRGKLAQLGAAAAEILTSADGYSLLRQHS